MRIIRPSATQVASALLLLAIAATANAEQPTRPSDDAPTVNASCVKARLSGLEIQDQPDLPSHDFCRSPESDESTEARAIIDQAERLNSKAAALFGLPLEKLLPRAFKLIVQKNPLGVMSSVVQSSYSNGRSYTRLTLGVFSDWQGEPLNAGVYSHELGHVIAEDPGNPDLPELYKDLSSTNLVKEMIADLTALYNTGNIVSPELGLPSCLQQFRLVTLDQTYRDRPADDFTVLHSWGRFTSCCDGLTRTGSHTAHSREFCQEYEKTNPKKPFAGFGPTRFSAAFYEANTDYAEAHALGLPLNSFLAALQAETRVDVAPLLIRAMREAGNATPRTYACNVPKLKNYLNDSTETHRSLAQAMEQLRKDMPPSTQATFRKLWASHGLDIGMQIAEIDSAHYSAGVALTHRADEYNDLTTARPGYRPDPKLHDSGCWKPDYANNRSATAPGYLDGDIEGCNFVCRRVN